MFPSVKSMLKYVNPKAPTSPDDLERMLIEHHDEQLRERYAELAFSFFIQKYFDREFEAFAIDAEMDIPECISVLSWNMADQMIVGKK